MPTYGTPVETSWSTTTTPKTAAITWSAGDLIVVTGLVADTGGSMATPTFSGGTFTAIGTALTTASHCWGHKWQCEATSGGSGNVSATMSGGLPWGYIVHVFATGTHAGIGNHSATGSTPQTASLAVSEDSSVIMALGDWDVGTDLTSDWTPAGATERNAEVIAGNYTNYVADWADRTAGTVSYGISVTPSGGAYTKLLVEVLHDAGSPPTTVDTWVRPLQVPLSRR